MQNLDVKEAIQKNSKTKVEIKKTRGVDNKWKKYRKHRDARKSYNNVTTTENAAKIVLGFVQIIKNKKSNII